MKKKVLKKKPIFPVKDFFLKGSSLKKKEYKRIVHKYIREHPISPIGTKETDGTD